MNLSGAGKTLEDDIYKQYGEEISSIEKVVKINQKDHAQGHICPKVEDWLRYGPSGLLKTVNDHLETAPDNLKAFYTGVGIALEAASGFISRYSVLAYDMAKDQKDVMLRSNLEDIGYACRKLSDNPPETFREALQSIWFLFVILQMESNASSFSPGRLDQYLYPFYKQDIESGRIDSEKALELLNALFIKFNQIVYMRNAQSAKYFAGFPIGFNVTIGGQTLNGDDATNELSYLILKTQDHLRLPQPNLTSRLHRNSPDKFIGECSRVIGLGNGMPQIVNDESIIPALKTIGIKIMIVLIMHWLVVWNSAHRVIILDGAMLQCLTL